MKSPQLTRYPHHSWLGCEIGIPGDGETLPVPFKAITSGISVVLKGSRERSWMSRGREHRWTERVGTVHFVPADFQKHVLTSSSQLGCEVFALLIPSSHIGASRAGDGDHGHSGPRRILAHSDPVLQRCMLRLSGRDPQEGVDQEVVKDQAGRRLLQRLAEITGAGQPDWHEERGVFDRRVLANLVAFIDANLEAPPTLREMGIRAGVGPSHFARKFRESTGVSLHRFIIRRRIQASLRMLREDSLSVAQVADDLGFASQCHFTRVFGQLTGMTPAKYRALCRSSRIRTGGFQLNDRCG